MVDGINLRSKQGGNVNGSFLGNNNVKKGLKEETVAFNFNGSGYVSPPDSNIMGFGPAANNKDTA